MALSYIIKDIEKEIEQHQRMIVHLQNQKVKILKAYQNESIFKITATSATTSFNVAYFTSLDNARRVYVPTSAHGTWKYAIERLSIMNLSDDQLLNINVVPETYPY
jgi:hypothetical protein